MTFRSMLLTCALAVTVASVPSYAAEIVPHAKNVQPSPGTKDFGPTPEPTAEAGFTARVLIAKGGGLYDPLQFASDGKMTYLSDDGALASTLPELTRRGGFVIGIDENSKVSLIAPVGTVTPPIGIDIAHPGFHPYEGQLFALSQQGVFMVGGSREPHVIQRIDLTRKNAVSQFCVLPNNGNNEPALQGASAKMGPDNGPYAGMFFAITGSNRTIYAATPDGNCRPFMTFKEGNGYRGLGAVGFTPDGQTMLVSTSTDEPKPRRILLKITPKGVPAGEYYDFGEWGGGSYAFAPKWFANGKYENELWFTGRAPGQQSGSTLVRRDKKGDIHPVATLSIGGGALAFANKDTILMTGGAQLDFAAGQELGDDGSVIEVKVK